MRQRKGRIAFPLEALDAKVSRAQSYALDTSTNLSYTSHLNAYMEFINLHQIDLTPTAETLSRFVVWISEYVKVSMAETYLAGITQRLRPFFPEIKNARDSHFLKLTIRGLKRLKGDPVSRKRPLSLGDLEKVVEQFGMSDDIDDQLFVTLLTTGFFELLRLGELVDPVDVRLINRRKTIRRDTLQVSPMQLLFILPASKTDKFFAGNTVMMRDCASRANPINALQRYLTLRDERFPEKPWLFLTSRGEPPNRRFFMFRFRQLFGNEFGGHSMRAGGATLLAQCGADWNIIQSLGRWSSETFRTYIRQHPILLLGCLPKPFVSSSEERSR